MMPKCCTTRRRRLGARGQRTDIGMTQAPNQAFRILSQRDLQALMRFGDYVDAVADGFRLLAEGRCSSPVPLHVHVPHGTFHGKAASLPRGRGYVGVKVNANFPDNRARNGLPTIQGAVFLADASDGRPLALLDSIEITRQRTGAATAVAARLLARADARTAMICGCGDQAPLQLMALRHALALQRVVAWDIDPQAARRFADRMAAELAIEVTPVTDRRASARASDVIVTCTPAREPFLGLDDVRPGTFIAAVGADNPDKSEIAPALMAKSAVVVDVLAQAAVMSDLHHAIAAGAMREADVRAEIGALLAQARPGRVSAEEITIFDSSGTGVQDVAAAACAYERACERDVGTACALA
jgi:ornithine cyclodeaminase/alanine dehydrogenase-like protein (mu-crystallin family)